MVIARNLAQHQKQEINLKANLEATTFATTAVRHFWSVQLPPCKKKKKTKYNLHNPPLLLSTIVARLKDVF